LRSYTAKYMKLKKEYMAIEWPEIVTEGKAIEECRQKVPWFF
jgi:hypothetical protein